ncbi:hypothetical protein DFJ58DRAFT_864760 [Suillus subalutaceus]|uniref:uncharacterized protein n=1 Tax=Suillus subalutaceus TaxID=48586 RepID=UPI001B86DEB7|nr:uncharacterized protein DFJ58DRAFT_864760 [Suillus subalutaceus]KAG1865552.1 hypothetical protein DFJ58DRAFT_864760 [Suillus subalutaceus]
MDIWSPEFVLTIGLDFKGQNMEVKGKYICIEMGVHVWDVIGGRFQAITNHGIDGIVKTVHLIPIDIQCVKADGLDTQTVTKEQGKNVSKSIGHQIYRGSLAKTNEGVDDAFLVMTKLVALCALPRQGRSPPGDKVHNCGDKDVSAKIEVVTHASESWWK